MSKLSDTFEARVRDKASAILDVALPDADPGPDAMMLAIASCLQCAAAIAFSGLNPKDATECLEKGTAMMIKQTATANKRRQAND